MPSSCDPSPSEQVRRTAASNADLPFTVCKTVIRVTRSDGVHAVQWRTRCCLRWWKVPPGLLLTFCFLLQNQMYKMNIISLSKAFFFGGRASLQLYFGIQPFWDMKVLPEHWSTLSTRSSCIKSLFFTLSHPHTNMHFHSCSILFCFLSLPHFQKHLESSVALGFSPSISVCFLLLEIHNCESGIRFPDEHHTLLQPAQT